MQCLIISQCLRATRVCTWAFLERMEVECRRRVSAASPPHAAPAICSTPPYTSDPSAPDLTRSHPIGRPDLSSHCRLDKRRTTTVLPVTHLEAYVLLNVHLAINSPSAAYHSTINKVNCHAVGPKQEISVPKRNCATKK